MTRGILRTHLSWNDDSPSGWCLDETSETRDPLDQAQEEICLFHTHGWALPFPKGKGSVHWEPGGRHSLFGSFWRPTQRLDGWGESFSQLMGKPDWYMSVYPRSSLASLSVLELERSRQDTSHRFCCKRTWIAEFPWGCFPWRWASGLPVCLLPALTALYQCSWKFHFFELDAWPGAQHFGWPKWGQWQL